MPNPAVALQTLSSVLEQRLVVDGFVSSSLPAPTGVGAPLYVIVPEHSTQVPLGPCEWGAIHGSTLPAQGARCVVVFDEREVPVVVWWEGATVGWEDSGWQTVASFKHSWEAGSVAPAYREIAGVAHLRGRATGGASGTEAFKIPAGPATQFVQIVGGAEGKETWVTIEGTSVYLSYVSGGSSASLDGISFPTS